MNILFLDVDGVLNSQAHPAPEPKINGLMGIADEHLDILKAIVHTFNLKIVVSSTWRKFDNQMNFLQEKMDEIGADIVGKTPTLDDGKHMECRGDEIELFMNQTDLDIDRFVIIDDDSDMGNVKDFHVKTAFKTGLKKEHREQVRLILAGELLADHPEL